MTPDQAKAARNLLGWSRERLQAISSISVSTIRSYERHGRLTRGSNSVSGADQVVAVQAALEAAGVEFIEESGGGPSVQLQSRNVTVHAAQDALAEAGPVTPAQLRAARDLLGWGIQKLAGRSGTTANLVRTYERSGRVAANYGLLASTDPLAAIRATLEEAGVEFINGDASGVRLRRVCGVTPAPSTKLSQADIDRGAALLLDLVTWHGGFCIDKAVRSLREAKLDLAIVATTQPHPRVHRAVLKAFVTLAGRSVVWDSAEQVWRERRESDRP